LQPHHLFFLGEFHMTKAKRKPVQVPHIDEGAVAWMHKHARANFWRVARWYDFDDLIQEGYSVWYRLVDKYCFPEKPYKTTKGNVMPPRDHKPVTERKHIMSLFKLSYTQHVHDLANRRTFECEDVVSSLIAVDQSPMPFWERVFPFADDFASLITHAEPAVRAALLAIDAMDAKELRSKDRVRLKGKTETLNTRVCKRAGLDPSVDILACLRSYLLAGRADGSVDLLDEMCNCALAQKTV